MVLIQRLTDGCVFIVVGCLLQFKELRQHQLIGCGKAAQIGRYVIKLTVSLMLLLQVLVKPIVDLDVLFLLLQTFSSQIKQLLLHAIPLAGAALR